MTNEKKERARLVFESHGPVVKANILGESKLYSRDIAELISDGLIRKMKTGYYIWNAAENDMTDLELASAVIERGIICLQSAAIYYDLSTINSSAVTMAVPSDNKRPALPDYPPIDLYVVPAKLFEMGLTKEAGAHGSLRIYDKERTVCDFFKRRNSLGDDLAMEVLKNYMNGKRRLPILMKYAKELRVKSIIKPYVEALV